MAAPPISASSRYIPESVTHFYFVTTIASYASPTRGELNAGTDLTPEIASTGDWGITSAVIATPDLATLFESQIPGKVSVSNATINMYADSTSADVRTLLPRGTLGYIVKFPEGDVTGRKMDVYPVKVTQQSKPTALSNPSVIALAFAVTKIPQENVAVP
jgi:hypothetical protein